MNESSFEILSALVDGEAVRAEEVAAALELPGAHGALVDYVRLREAVDSDPARPSDAFAARIRRRIPDLDRPETRRRGRAALWAAAALLAVLLPLGTYLLSSPPAANAPPAPEPNHVLTFEPGVDWVAQ